MARARLLSNCPPLIEAAVSAFFINQPHDHRAADDAAGGREDESDMMAPCLAAH